MALTPLARTEITRAIAMARKINEEVKPVVDGLNILYDSGGGLKTTITQADLDAEPSLSGLTKTQLDDAFNVLTNTMRTAIVNGYTSLAHLAARG